MEQLDHFYGYFTLVLGAIFTLIGFKIYKPFKGEEGEKKFQKMKTFYRLGGIGLVIWGLIGSNKKGLDPGELKPF